MADVGHLSLQTGRAVLPHPAFQSVGSTARLGRGRVHLRGDVPGQVALDRRSPPAKRWPPSLHGWTAGFGPESGFTRRCDSDCCSRPPASMLASFMSLPKIRWGILSTAAIARKNWKAIHNTGNAVVWPWPVATSPRAHASSPSASPRPRSIPHPRLEFTYKLLPRGTSTPSTSR